MSAHFVIAPVVLPAIAAGLGLLIARDKLARQRAISVAVTLALLALAAVNWQAAQAGPVPYFLGNWPAPFGIVLMLDGLSALMLALLAVLAFVVLAYVMGAGWDRRGRHFHALLMFQLMGLNGAFLTADAFNLFVFFEVLLIASYGLMVHGGGAERMRAGMGYVAFNLAGSALFLLALSVIYNITGTLNMADLAQKLPRMQAEDAALIRASAMLLLGVFAIKGALVPLHFWLPRSYAAAPAPVAALFAIMTKLGAYGALRFGTLVYPPDLAAMDGLWGKVMWGAALVSILVGAAGVLAAGRLSVMIGFAVIGSMGVVFLSLSAFTQGAIAAALYYMVHSTLAAALMYLIAGQIAHRRGRDDLGRAGPHFSGAGPLAVLFLLGAIAMVGLPPLSGFLGKVMVLSALSADAPVAWSVILTASLITMIGFARAGSALFWRIDPAAAGPSAPRHPAAQGAIWALVALLVGLAVFAAPITAALGDIAGSLTNPAAYIGAQKLPPVTP